MSLSYSFFAFKNASQSLLRYTFISDLKIGKTKMDLRYFLQRMGIKPTATRITVLRALQEIAPMPSDWTMPELMQTMQRKNLPISQATLTNVLNTFNNKHLISRHVDKEGIVTYRIFQFRNTESY